MGTITAAKAGNWSDTTVWNGGVVPGNNDTADLNGFVVTMDIPTVPASGTLLALISPAKAGRLDLVMSGANTYAINATTITAGTNTIINVSGAAPSAALTITGNVAGGAGATYSYGILNNSTGTITVIGNITGGGNSYAHGIYNQSTGTITVTGDVTGGSGPSAYGIRNSSEGTIIVTGNITGGSSSLTHGLYNVATGAITVTGNITGGSGLQASGLFNVSTGAVTLNDCNMINSAYAIAYVGQPPTTWNLNANNYVQWGAVKFYQDIPTDAELAAAVWAYANRTLTA